MAPPAEAPRDRRDHPQPFRHGPDVGLREAELEEERSRQRGSHHHVELVEDDEQQDPDRAAPREKLQERLDDRLLQRSRPLRGQFRFRGEKGRGHPHDEGAGHQEIDDAPRHPVGEDQGDRARGEHRHAVSEDVHPRPRSQLLRGEDLGAPGVDHDVLARAAEGDEERQERQRAGMRRRRGERHRGDDEEEGRLGHQHPPAATAEERGDEPVHQRGPEVLDRVRQADEGEDPDHRQVDLFGRHPRLQGRAGQRQGDPGGETEQQDEKDAPVPESVQKRGHAGYRTTLL